VNHRDPSSRPADSPRGDRATVTEETTLLAFLLRALGPRGRRTARNLLKFGRVAVNGAATTRSDHPLRPGDVVSVGAARPAPAVRPLARAGIAVLHEDDWLIAVDKPAGLLSVSAGDNRTDTAYYRLNEHLRLRDRRRPGRVFVVHRLDRETSGVLLFARNESVKRSLQDNWADVTKTYRAVVEGVPARSEGVVEGWLTEAGEHRVYQSGPGPRARWAVTRYRVLRSRAGYSLLEVGLETGRKHQIRVHLAGLGHPVVGDHRYGARTDPAGRMALHAWRLALAHPVTRRPLALTSRFPAKLARLVD
jgi:23S rRNA pseudouridine1911/1915/1917 synthase